MNGFDSLPVSESPRPGEVTYKDGCFATIYYESGDKVDLNTTRGGAILIKTNQGEFVVSEGRVVGVSSRTVDEVRSDGEFVVGGVFSLADKSYGKISEIAVRRFHDRDSKASDGPENPFELADQIVLAKETYKPDKVIELINPIKPILLQKNEHTVLDLKNCKPIKQTDDPNTTQDLMAIIKISENFYFGVICRPNNNRHYIALLGNNSSGETWEIKHQIGGYLESGDQLVINRSTVEELAGEGIDDSISRTHCQVQLGIAGLTILDHSTNGTEVFCLPNN